MTYKIPDKDSRLRTDRRLRRKKQYETGQHKGPVPIKNGETERRRPVSKVKMIKRQLRNCNKNPRGRTSRRVVRMGSQSESEILGMGVSSAIRN